MRGSINGITVAGVGNETKEITSNTLWSPAAIFNDSQENLYVADVFDYRIQL